MMLIFFRGISSCIVRTFKIYSIDMQQFLTYKSVKLQKIPSIQQTRLAFLRYSSALEVSDIGRAKDHLSELQKLTGWNEKQLAEAVQKYPKLLRSSLTSVSEMLALLESDGINKKQISHHPWLLEYRASTVKGKLSLLRRLGITNDTVPLLRYSRSKLQNILKTIHSRGDSTLHKRIIYLSKHLNIDIYEVLELTKEHSPLLTLEFSKIRHIMNLLENAGVEAEDIRRDLWIFRHNENTMTERIKRAQKVCAPVKTWMLRCTEDVFQNSLDRWCEKIKVLGENHTTIDYLSKRLNCSREYILFLNEKDPRLLTIQPWKIKEILDFLFQKGFSPEQVCSSTRIFHYSLATIERRLKDFSNLNYHPSSLTVFCTTNKLHSRFLRKLRYLRKHQVGEQDMI